jgi:hypothetical protein
MFNTQRPGDEPGRLLIVMRWNGLFQEHDFERALSGFGESHKIDA